MDALQDPSAKITYPVLIGVRKQSISDVERLFSTDMVAFMGTQLKHSSSM